MFTTLGSGALWSYHSTKSDHVYQQSKLGGVGGLDPVLAERTDGDRVLASLLILAVDFEAPPALGTCNA